MSAPNGTHAGVALPTRNWDLVKNGLAWLILDLCGAPEAFWGCLGSISSHPSWKYWFFNQISGLQKFLYEFSGKEENFFKNWESWFGHWITWPPAGLWLVENSQRLFWSLVLLSGTRGWCTQVCGRNRQVCLRKWSAKWHFLVLFGSQTNGDYG